MGILRHVVVVINAEELVPADLRIRHDDQHD